MNAVADYLVEIKLDSNKKDKHKFTLINTLDKKSITNVKYEIFHNVTFLYLSTSDNIYFKNMEIQN